MANPDDVLDVVGVGFGPSNIALAIALDEIYAQAGGRVSAMFLERQPACAWHPGMLLPGSRMQISFLKDLVTLRNPQSRYSFVSYLQDRGRLHTFINGQELFPTRIEFQDYLSWCAAEFADQVLYGQEVIEVTEDESCEGTLKVWYREVGGARETRSLRTRNLVIATGLRPSMPENVVESPSIWHSSAFLTNLPALNHENVKSIAVVGSGQSAGELVDYLHDAYQSSEIHAIFDRYGYQPADDSPFVNAIFDAAAVDEHYNARADGRAMLTNSHRTTNYSVVDRDLIKQLHRRAYGDQVTGRQRLYLHNMTRLASAQASRDEVELVLRSQVRQAVYGLTVDLLICATGYHQMNPLEFFGELARNFGLDGSGRCIVSRDHKIELKAGKNYRIYLNGGSEHTHGLSSTLLSNVAVRSGEIAASLIGRSLRRIEGSTSAMAVVQ